MQLMLLKFSLEPVWEWSVLYENSVQCLPCLSLPSLSFNQTIAVLLVSLWRRFSGLDQPIIETHLSADVITPNYSWRHQCLEIPCGIGKLPWSKILMVVPKRIRHFAVRYFSKILYNFCLGWEKNVGKQLSPSFLSEISFHFGVVPILGVNLAVVSRVQSIYYVSG